MKHGKGPVVSLMAVILVACGGGDVMGTGEIIPTSTQPVPTGFEEIPDDVALFRSVFHKYISVFGVHTLSTEDTPNEKHLHLAAVLAQYLDSNQDGTPDNPAVVAKMRSERAWVGIAKDQDDRDDIEQRLIQFLESASDAELPEIQKLIENGGTMWSTEIDPPSPFPDATIEEILHLVSDQGYTKVYADLKREAGSKFALAMDQARGGHFEEVHKEDCQDDSDQCALPPGRDYPAGAWYTYVTGTCNYDCMMTEYYFWALTSILGHNQATARCENISHEWPLCTTEQVQIQDPAIYEMMTAPQYNQPTFLPDGSYTGPASVLGP